MKGTRIWRGALLLVLLGLLTSACASTTSSPSGDITSSESDELTTEPPVVPTPAPGTAVIHGVILGTTTDMPLTLDQIAGLHLAELVPAEEGSPAIVTFDKPNSPLTVPDDNGIFVFTDVAPGQYSIVVDNYLQDTLTRSADDPASDLLFTVEDGDVRDVGVIYGQ